MNSVLDSEKPTPPALRPLWNWPQEANRILSEMLKENLAKELEKNERKLPSD